MPAPVVALLNAPSTEAPPHRPAADPFMLLPGDAPVATALDLGITRGDGVFETISVGAGRAQALEPHLARLARSAAMLELPAPDLSLFRTAVFAVLGDFAEVPEAFVKLVYTRGDEGGRTPTGWVTAQEAPDHGAARTDGIRIAVLDRGYPHDVAATAPWLLQGAKTLSYAINRAAVREVHRRGADDVLFISSDGYLLEGATANVLLLVGDRLVTPSTSLGILAGTTQADAFRFARKRGLTTSYQVLRRDALESADAVWLVSSVRHAAPVRAVDGVPRSVDRELSAALNEYLLRRTD